MKHILFILTSTDRVGTRNHQAGYEFSEVADPYLEFIRQGYTVDFASIKGGSPPAVGYDPLHENSRIFRESPGFRRLSFSHQLSEVDVDAYDAIFFPGGLGPMVDMLTDPLVKETIRKVWESGRVVGGVCHGPVALLNVELSEGRFLVAGRQINSFTEAEEAEEGHHLEEIIPFMLEQALVDQGGLFSKTAPFQSYVVNDANLVTGQNPASASGVALEMIRLIEAQVPAPVSL